MVTPQVSNYLYKLGYKLPEVCIKDIFLVKKIVFPGVRLIISNKDKIDHLFIDRSEGFPYAVAILAYYFAWDSEEREGLFAPTYRAIILNNIEYTKLSPTLFDNLAIRKFVMLERHKMIDDYKDYKDYDEYGDCGDHTT